jgi:hypothetical protein
LSFFFEDNFLVLLNNILLLSLITAVLLVVSSRLLVFLVFHYLLLRSRLSCPLLLVVESPACLCLSLSCLSSLTNDIFLLPLITALLLVVERLRVFLVFHLLLLLLVTALLLVVFDFVFVFVLNDTILS